MTDIASPATTTSVAAPDDSAEVLDAIPHPRSGAHDTGPGLIKPEYDLQLVNEDLAPLKEQTWKSYAFFAFWMSDVHSVGGYITAGSLFALGLAGWQVFLSLLVGITIVYFLCNLVARPSHATGTPYPVASRIPFGVKGAFVPALIRGLIAVAWYGVQTYLASTSLVLLLVKLWPGMAPLADKSLHGFAGLSLLGWVGFLVMWVAQAFVFWRGMAAIRRFIDFCGPAVYVVMFALAIYLVAKAGWSNISLNLSTSGTSVTGWAAFGLILSSIAVVVSYFSGPMLNYGDFARYGKTFGAIKRGNLLGLPVNFIVFSALVVVTTAATKPVFGEFITDPVKTVNSLDSTTAAVLGALTFMIATVGINIVANFIAPAFDFSNLAPQRITWRMGGMIAAVGSVIITPWNWYDNDEAIRYTLGILGCFIGPLYGVLIADYFLIKKQRVVVDDLYTVNPKGRYWYKNGWNPVAVGTTAICAVIGVLLVVPKWSKTGFQGFLHELGSYYSWIVCATLAFALYFVWTRVAKNSVPTDDLPAPAKV